MSANSHIFIIGVEPQNTTTNPTTTTAPDVTTSTSETTTPTEPVFKLGDIDDDGDISIFDALEVLKNLVGMDGAIKTGAVFDDRALNAAYAIEESTIHTADVLRTIRIHRPVTVGGFN